MHIHPRSIIACMALLAAASLWGGPLDEGKRLYLDGDYEAAVVQLRDAVRRAPRDGNANYYLGATLVAMGNLDEAQPYLVKAAGRGVTDAYPLLVEHALANYDADGASGYIDDWRSRLRRNRRSEPDELETYSARAVMLRNMLARVQRIEILDSLTVLADDFFNAYRLSAEAGRILPPEAVERIGAGAGAYELGAAFMPENRTEILWAQADSAGIMSLYGAGILDDGTPDHSAPLDPQLSEGGSAAYPFLMPDGVTLYFANDGANSLGGYDIFMTSRTRDEDGDSYYQPQNLGMPYNSPYDDYMLAIDESTGLGWWATDRNRIPDSLTVYVFAPADLRVNVEPTDSNLVALARLSDISLTRRPGVDYSALMASKLPQQQDSSVQSASVFTLDMGNGKIYTSLGDFRNTAARTAMAEYLGAALALRRHLEAEQELRNRYAGGDLSVADAIRSSERETAGMRRNLRRLRNTAVRLETQQ